MAKNHEPKVQNIRFAVQMGIILICAWIGLEFYVFVSFLESGGEAYFLTRPPGAEGFLPISAFMSWLYFIKTGLIHSYHPAGFVIFMAIVVVSLVFGKSFCSWICPVGFLSELVGDWGQHVFRKRFKLPRFLDYMLRSLKYVLLTFFVITIWGMSLGQLQAFLDSPYNLMADVKMYYFFANLSQTGLVVLIILLGLSIVVRGFWCRYLCPYGALLGIASLLSPHKIRRNTASCIDCGKCAQACPSFIAVDQVKTVISDECTTCLSCLDACPVADTLNLQNVISRQKRSKKRTAVAIVMVFFVIIAIAMLTGLWHNNIPITEYLKLFPHLASFSH